jgi:hypothetical protein
MSHLLHSPAALAPIFDDLALSVALGTLPYHWPLEHVVPVAMQILHTLPVAAGTRQNALSSLPVALLTDDIMRNLESSLGAGVDLLQCHVDLIRTVADLVALLTTVSETLIM